jgi:hypothetical protein
VGGSIPPPPVLPLQARPVVLVVFAVAKDLFCAKKNSLIKLIINFNVLHAIMAAIVNILVK